MIRNTRAAVVVAAALVVAQTASTASASWMNDWIGGKSTSSGPNYLDGQARGYLSGGSYSARWPVSQNNNLMSVQPPKLSAGCGGIDFYAGSISFLKPDMLVKKLQNVLQNSAGLAFQLALDTFSPKIASYVGMMEDISNKLNSLSMDDCTAAKGLVTGVRSAAEDIAEGYKMGEFQAGISQGLSDSYSAMKGSIPAVATLADVNNWTNLKKGQPAGTLSGLSGCPAGIQELFPAQADKYPVSVLELVGKQMALPTSHTDLLRGLAGDVIIGDMVSAGLPVTYRAPCSMNHQFTLDDIISGSVETMDKNGVCTGLPGTDQTLKAYVGDKMQVIMTNLINKSALTATDVTFISGMPTPTLYGLRMAVMTGQQSSLTPLLVNTAAAGLSMKAMKDLMARYEEILAFMDQAKGLSDMGESCRLGAIQQDLAKNVMTARTNINAVYSTMNESYVTALNEFTSSFTMNSQLQALNEQLKSTISKNFGASVAQRMARSF
ncbi:conjugal transfer protein TraH [Geomonas subterranea]|uniref:conjugal transfer protein TraH n=1 Tax=Geomonas subterranea TaxID=2847989 RepID=UPI001CD1EF80|nr:conjugal transfer protein TraH [Geomonas fuzhouensis]